MGKPEYWDKERAINEVPNYVDPRECFVWFVNNRIGWRPIGWPRFTYPCAHYVAHQKGIKRAKGTRCDEGNVVRIPDVLKWIDSKGWEDRVYLVRVRVGDIWASSKHMGIVTRVTPSKKPKIEITHCSSSENGGVKTSTYGSGITGGVFYGPTIKTNWLGNVRTTEYHDLSNTNTNCQIGEIQRKVYFSSKAEALAYGYDACFYCIPGESTR